MWSVGGMRRGSGAGAGGLRGGRPVGRDGLHNEEVAVMNDFNAAREKAIKGLDARGRGLIDHFFLRALELMLLALVLGSFAAWILLRWFPGRRPERGERFLDRAA